jgi:hypothetical protein
MRSSWGGVDVIVRRVTARPALSPFWARTRSLAARTQRHECEAVLCPWLDVVLC